MIPNSTVEHVSYKDDQVHLRLNNGEEEPGHPYKDDQVHLRLNNGEEVP